MKSLFMRLMFVSLFTLVMTLPWWESEKHIAFLTLHPIPSVHAAGARAHRLSPAPVQARVPRKELYAPSMAGAVKGFRLAGIEPDGDPLNQVVLQTRLSASAGTPAMNLIINSYLENFKPDTTPILPDLLHPNQTAQNLGGFLQGKALLTDDAGNVLYIGSFLAEAFINDNSNHAAMRLYGSGAAFRGSAQIKGSFRLRHDGSLRGNLSGRISLPPSARRQIRVQQGAQMKPLKQIINVVTVKPAAMIGRATARSHTVPLRTGFSRTTAPSPAPVHSTTSRGVSTLTYVAGIGALISLLVGTFLFWSERRQSKRAV